MSGKLIKIHRLAAGIMVTSAVAKEKTIENTESSLAHGKRSWNLLCAHL